MFKLEIETDNAAFQDGNAELIRLLQRIIKDLERGYSDGELRDINGNSCGEWTYEK